MIIAYFKSMLQLLSEEETLEKKGGSRKLKNRDKAVAKVQQVKWLEPELVCGTGMREARLCL